MKQLISITKEENKMGSGINGELTYGDKAVGRTFNPSGLLEVEELKKSYAYIIDTLDMQRRHSEDPEVKRLCSIAVTEAQGAQMWAVKAVTFAGGIKAETEKK